MHAQRNPYYKFPVMVVKLDAEGPDEREDCQYESHDLDGEVFLVPGFSDVMKFLAYHGCYGVTRDEMERLRAEVAIKKGAQS